MKIESPSDMIFELSTFIFIKAWKQTCKLIRKQKNKHYHPPKKPQKSSNPNQTQRGVKNHSTKCVKRT